MKHIYDKLIAVAIVGIFLWTTAMAIHNLYEIQTSLDRAEEILSDQPYPGSGVKAEVDLVVR